MCCRLSGQSCSNIQPEMNVACSCSRQADGCSVQCCSLRVSCSRRAAADTPPERVTDPGHSHISHGGRGKWENLYNSIFLFLYFSSHQGLNACILLLNVSRTKSALSEDKSCGCNVLQILSVDEIDEMPLLAEVLDNVENILQIVCFCCFLFQVQFSVIFAVMMAQRDWERHRVCIIYFYDNTTANLAGILCL